MLSPYTKLEPSESMIIPVQKDLELVQDFNSADNVTGALHVWWLGHSGFLLKWKGVGIVIDPYLSDSMALQYKGRGRGWPRMTERVVDPLLLSGVDILISTQNHLSHLDPEGSKWNMVKFSASKVLVIKHCSNFGVHPL